MPELHESRSTGKKKSRQTRATAVRQRGELQAAENLALLRAIFESSTDEIFVKDLEGKYLLINTAGAAAWGHTVEQMIGKTDAELYPAPIAEEFRERDRHVISTGETITYQNTAVHGAHAFLVTKGPLREAGGKIVGVFGIGRDTIPSRRAEQLQEVVYRLAEAADKSPTLDDLYRVVHENIGMVMPAQNFYIALYDEKEDLLSFPYFVDEVDEPMPPMKPGRGLTAYVLRSGKSLLCTLAVHEELERRGEIELIGGQSPIWLGVPLRLGEKTIGVMVVQHYSNASAYTERELHMLEYVSGQVAKAIERKRSEEALRESESHLRAVLESEPECVKRLAPDGTLLEMNPAGLAMIEANSAAQVVGKSVYGLVAPAHREAFRQLTERVCRGEPGSLEFELIGLKGTRRWMDTRAVPLRRDPHGVTELLGVTRDITDRKHAVEALQESEARLRDLFDKATLGIYRGTQEGRILDANPALVKMLGYASKDELLGVLLPKDIYCKPEDRENFLRILRSAGSAENIAVQWKRKDGRVLTVRLSGRSVRSASGGFELIECFVEDITERQALEKQFYAAQKFEAIGHLAGGVAHDFNNVLGAILGWAELGLDLVPEEGKVRKGLTVIIDQAKHAAGLTRQLLAFARRQHMEPRVLNLNNSVREFSVLMGSVIGRDIELKTSLSPNIHSVLADPTHLEQVLMNLCVNARDAMPRGGKLVIETKNSEVDEDYCRLYPYAQPGRYVQLSVTDTGEGMDPETLDHIFEPFFTTKEHGKGTGLGLATVYGIAKQHGGFIHAYSEVGRGSTFHVYFPASSEAVPKEKKPEVVAQKGGTESILLAEDNEDLAASAREALESRGYQVIWARNGEEAVQMFDRHKDRVALLVFDVVMPLLNGPEAYMRIRACHQNLPALFTSGHSFETSGLNTLVEGGTELLQKPYGMNTLLLKVRELLDQK